MVRYFRQRTYSAARRRWAALYRYFNRLGLGRWRTSETRAGNKIWDRGRRRWHVALLHGAPTDISLYDRSDTYATRANAPWMSHNQQLRSAGRFINNRTIMNDGTLWVNNHHPTEAITNNPNLIRA